VKHVIFGGSGFVGRYTTQALMEAGEHVLICDIAPPMVHGSEFMHVDITAPHRIAEVPIAADDIVYNLAARMLHPIVRRDARYEYFFSVDYEGAVNIVQAMERAGCNRLVQFSTDMVYGRLRTAPPVKVDHPREPIGEYSASKKALEDYCVEQRSKGLRVSIFRPRLINGPGRVGILGKLFALIQRGLPVPMIGDGENRYQMISVFDCASAAVQSAQKGVVNGEFNLGSAAPPKVKDLLRALIRHAGSRSALIPTPAAPLKAVLRLLDRLNMPLLVPEQFEIADCDYVVDIEPTVRMLDWQPKHTDEDMMLEAYARFVDHKGTPG
jgi:dTDP-glucose 4,6-dehydratase